VSVERLIRRSLEDDSPGRPISERGRLAQRSVEAYLKAGVRPRWMERLMEIDGAIARHRAELEHAHTALRRECGADAERFARRWRAHAESLDFGALNELIVQHNEWYPIERDLPMDPRTRDYVRVGGRSHRRPVLDARWVLEHFPAP
jgi:hypothetical protein